MRKHDRLHLCPRGLERRPRDARHGSDLTLDRLVLTAPIVIPIHALLIAPRLLLTPGSPEQFDLVASGRGLYSGGVGLLPDVLYLHSGVDQETDRRQEAANAANSLKHFGVGKRGDRHLAQGYGRHQSVRTAEHLV